MAMNPPTATEQQQHFNAKTGKVYKAAEVKAARQKLEAHLAEHRPEHPFTGPIYLQVGWLFYNPEKKDQEWNISRPDLDNLEKGLLDCMTRLGFWKDDSQICQKYTEKKWTPDIPGIAIMIQEAET